MRRFFAAVACLLALALAATVSAAEVKVGYVNMQRALENSAAGQAAARKLSELWEKYKAEITADKEKMEQLKAEIDKQSLLWNEKTRRDKEDELRRMERDYQRMLKDVQDEIKARESEFSETISKEILKVVEEIGKADGYTVILEKKSSAILYAPPTADLTDRVIKAYDAQKQ